MLVAAAGHPRRVSTPRARGSFPRWLIGFALASLLAGCAEPVEYPYPPPPPPPSPPGVEPAAVPEPYTQPGPPVVPPSSLADAAAPAPSASGTESDLVYTYPTGQWVYIVDRGWVWIPAGATTVEMEGVPYVYLYTPTIGWTWYLSPWGWGPYVYGPWFRHPWHPYGWHGHWVAHPHVIERLGPRGPGRGHR
jgi:hypothetical protein